MPLLKQPVIDALAKIAKGIRFKETGNYCAEINGVTIHCRLKNIDRFRVNLFPFNINQNTLKADYELWVCGSADCYFLLPIEIIKAMYNSPDAYRNNYPGQEMIAIVNVDVEKKIVKYGKPHKNFSIEQFLNRTL